MDDGRLRAVLDTGGIGAAIDGIDLRVDGQDPVVPARVRVGEVAAAACGAAAAAAARLWRTATGEDQAVRLTVRDALAASLMGTDRLNGEPIDRYESPVSDFFECRDGEWIHLQGQLPHLHQRTLDLLGCAPDHAAIAAAVRGWNGVELEEELAERGLCGGVARTAAQWAAHPQGQAITGRPIVEVVKIGDGDPVAAASATRPLGAVRVLEFARILSAPTSGRTLAEHGADVLNVSSPHLPGVFHAELNTGLGKHSCYLDLDDPADHARTLTLAGECDVLINGYRRGGLERRGLDPHELAGRRGRGLVYVSINCYGHEGPWRQRRGWEQMAQSVSGLAAHQGAPTGRPLRLPILVAGRRAEPIAPNDYITGYLAAYGAMAALHRRATEGGSYWVRVSLTQTAMWMLACGEVPDAERAPGFGDLTARYTESTMGLGTYSHLIPVASMSRTPPGWLGGPPVKGADPAAWRSPVQ